MSVGRFFLFSFSQNLNRSTSAHFHITTRYPIKTHHQLNKIEAMPINYKNYPPNWKTEIRPAILERAKNRCEFCGVENYNAVFRGFINRNQPTQREVYQDVEGRVYDAKDSRFLFTDFYADIYPLTGNPNQQAIKVVLTIAHLDHNTQNNDYSNLKALCQRCHNRYDATHRKQNRKKQPNLFE